MGVKCFTTLLRYYVTTLLRYYVTTLLRYYVTTWLCDYVTTTWRRPYDQLLNAHEASKRRDP